MRSGHHEDAPECTEQASALTSAQNGSITRAPIGAKSAPFPVATDAFRAKAWAAIIRSAPGCPSPADSPPQISASSTVKSSTRSAKTETVRSSQRRRSWANSVFLGSCWRIPRSISPRVITLRNSSPSCLASSQARAFGARSARRTAEMTFVSRI